MWKGQGGERHKSEADLSVERYGQFTQRLVESVVALILHLKRRLSSRNLPNAINQEQIKQIVTRDELEQSIYASFRAMDESSCAS